MASLWKIKDMKPFTKFQKPSPNANLNLLKSTRKLLVFSQFNIVCYVNSIKKLSLLIPRPVRKRLPGKRLLSASMTVEAAVILPICLIFFMNIGYAIEMIRLHNNLQYALTVSGNRSALYGSVVGESTAESVLATVYLRESVIACLGKSYLEDSPLTYGCNGMNFLESEMLTEKDHVDVTLTYSVSPFTSFSGLFRFRMANRYYAHRWNGYDVLSEGQDCEEIVYVTESGQVVHLDKGCKHLCLTVREVACDSIERERNASGGRYSACERCYREDMCGDLFVTKEGNRYHSRRDCSGLKRTVYAIGSNEAEERGYRICSDCAKRLGK